MAIHYHMMLMSSTTSFLEWKDVCLPKEQHISRPKNVVSKDKRHVGIMDKVKGVFDSAF
jgi:hypothetical protein